MYVVFELLIVAVGCGLSGAYLKVSIYPLGKNVIYKEDETLNLTCKVFDSKQPDVSFDLSWSLPIRENQSRISVQKSHNQLTVTVQKLRETDTGQYICEVSDNGNVRRQKISVYIGTDRERCMQPFFACGNTLCIPWNYVCDGYRDCPDGTDESYRQCGQNPCEGKFFCKERCIPKKLCCDPSVNPNCTVNYIRPCCQRLLNSILPLDIMKMDDPGGQVQYKYQNIGFYQSTAYTMISCAIAFIFMSAIMLIAVCQKRMFLHSSRPNQQRRFWFDSLTSPPNSHQVNFRNADNTLTLPVLNCARPNEVMDPLENFVLLTYDSNTGFQIAEEYGPKPPPYTENNVGTPPPPYTSTLDISNATEAENVDEEVCNQRENSTSQTEVHPSTNQP